ncbi:MAG: DegT/DnrJ/EryC1/StrS family aminotransferase, partial [Oscillospiraceae bacterium]
ADTMRSGWLTTGNKTKAFEKALAESIGNEKAVCFNSATAGLELILRLLEIGVGDEVITTAYTYTATAAVIVHTGAKLVLCDTAKNSFEIDYSALHGCITSRTKAIIGVDIGGVICDYNSLVEIAQQHKDKFHSSNEWLSAIGRIAIIADAAHSLGAIKGDKNSGQLADFSCFSFHAVKNLTTGEGGAVTWQNHMGWNNEAIYKAFMLLSLHGQDKDALAKTKQAAWEYDVITTGYKYNMTDIAASIGLVQLQRYPQLLQKRHKLISIYNEALQTLPLKLMAHSGENFTSSGHLYMARLLGFNSSKRGEIIKKMAENGIVTNVHYKPLPLLTAYKRLGFDITDFPNSYAMYCNEITLPLHTMMSENDVLYVCDSLKGILL